MFRITEHKGFQMKLANGCTVSVQWGPANFYGEDYGNCEKRNLRLHLGDTMNPQRQETWDSKTAEVAAWDENGVDHNFDPRPAPEVAHTFHDEDKFSESCRSNIVKGWLNVEQVLEFINDIAKNGINYH